MRHPLARVAEIFLEKGAISPETALEWKDLGLPMDGKKRVDDLQVENIPVVRINGKYYLSKKLLGTFQRQMREAHPIGRWLQHTAAVPKGFLRYRVMQLLREQPMSGSELTSEIGNETGGNWTPKPGSMYPLLKRLLKDGFTKGLPIEGGIKRYELTEMGRKFFDEDVSESGALHAKLGINPFFGRGFSFPLGLPKAQQGLLAPAQRVFRGLVRLREAMVSNVSDEAISDAQGLLIRFADEIDELIKRMSRPAD